METGREEKGDSRVDLGGWGSHWERQSLLGSREIRAEALTAHLLPWVDTDGTNIVTRISLLPTDCQSTVEPCALTVPWTRHGPGTQHLRVTEPSTRFW